MSLRYLILQAGCRLEAMQAVCRITPGGVVRLASIAGMADGSIIGKGDDA